MRPIRILAVVICLILFVLPLTAHAATKTPPKARMVYVLSGKNGSNSGLYMFIWPNGPIKKINLRIIGKHKLVNYVGSPLFSPDGKKLVFLANLSYPYGKDTGPFEYTVDEIWLYDIAKNTAKPLLQNDLDYQDIEWSPNGRFLTAISPEGSLINGNQSWGETIHIWDLKTGKHRVLVQSTEQYVWLNDEKHIIYQKYNGYENEDFYSIDIFDGKIKKQEITPDMFILQGYSSNGEFLLYESRAHELKILDNVNRKSRVLAKNTGDISPLWSPDSKMIATAQVEKKDKYSNAQYIVRTINSHTGAKRNIGRVFFEDMHLKWSRNNDWIITWGIIVNGEKTWEQAIAVSVSGEKPVPLMDRIPNISGIDWHELP